MERRQRRPAEPKAEPKAQLRWEGAIFAFASNMMLVTALTGLVQSQRLPIEYEVLATLFGPLLAGVLTALYVRQRGGMHAFLGGLLSLLPLTFFIFQGSWQPALYAGSFCTIGGALAELWQRRLGKRRGR